MVMRSVVCGESASSILVWTAKLTMGYGDYNCESCGTTYYGDSEYDDNGNRMEAKKRYDDHGNRIE